MDVVELSGCFIKNKKPVDGEITILPSKSWLYDYDGMYYPTLGVLDLPLVDGRFCVPLTRTDQHGIQWYYRFYGPMGEWTFELNQPGPVSLVDLVMTKVRQ